MELSGLVTEKAMVDPDRDCLVDVARTWSYAETADAIEKHTAALRASGVSRGDRVGVHLRKSAAGFIAMHAVVAAGAVAVPLDPASPPSRLARICEQMDIAVVISHSPLKKSVTAVHDVSPLRTIIGVDFTLDGCDVISSLDVEGIDPVAPTSSSPDDLAYIVTTSGSTGEPKGISHTHRSGRAYADMVRGTYDLVADDRITDISPHHFDISTFSLWGTPLAGATNVIVNEAYQRLPASHSQLLADRSVTVWYSVPFLLQQLVLRGDLANRDLSTLRWVHFGGEVIPSETISTMMTHCPNAKFANIFGPAETNQFSLAVFETPPLLGAPLTIGRPLEHATVRIVEPGANEPLSNHVVPTGEVGEMWVATPQLMRGYWDRDEVNQQVLKGVDGLCFYRTGDLGSVDEAGELSFCGRVDHQVKVRGFRIELEGVEVEFEALVQRDGSAENVVVSVMRQNSGEDEVVAGVLGAAPEFDDAQFLAAAALVVPAYAVPSRVVHIPETAFTGSGKLDRRVLREHAVALTEDAS